MKKKRVLKILVRIYLLSLFPVHLFGQLDKNNIFSDKLNQISSRFPTNGDSAIGEYTKLLEMPEIQMDLVKKGQVLLSIGYEYFYKNKDAGHAFAYYNEALECADRSNNCALKIRILILQSAIYYDLKQMDKFFMNYENAGVLSKQCLESKKGVYIHTQLGLNYFKIGDYIRAEQNLLMADSIITVQPNTELRDKSFAYNIITLFYKSRNNFIQVSYFAGKAKKVLLSDIQKSLKKGNKDLAPFFLIIDILRNAGQVDSAIYFAHYVTNLPPTDYHEYDRDAIYKAHKVLSEMYFSKEDWTKSLFHKDQYIGYLDSLVKIQRTDNAYNKINSLENQLSIERKNLQIEKDRYSLLLAASIIGAILIIAGQLYYTTKKLKNINIDLKAQKQELTYFNNTRVKMFTILSHDMLSPLAGFQNMLELYQDESFSQSEFKAYLGRQNQIVKTLVKTIKDILNWSHIQINKDTTCIETQHIRNIVNEQFDLHALAAKEKQIELINNVPEDCNILADFNHISLIIRNFIDNAIKYTNKGGLVEVSCISTNEGKKLIFQDNGIGMSEEDLQNLFVDDAYLSTQGKGLGLQMIKDLAKSNNYTIYVESKKNHGSTFTLLIKNA